MSQQQQDTQAALAHLANTVKSNGVTSDMKLLSFAFKPSSADVLCKRGKTAFNHNKHFREIIQQSLERYSNASSKLEKSMVVSDVVDRVRSGSPNGGFVREINGSWYEVGDTVAREKVGGAFRDMLHNQYKSSTKAKKRRREKAQDASSVESKGEEVKATITTSTVASEHKTSASDPPAAKRFRVVSPTPPSSTSPNTLSPRSTATLCAFGDLLKDIASRKQELTTQSPLHAIRPTLPPPARFPSAPKTISFLRGCSVESTVSFDLDEMDSVDEFDLGLKRFTSVATVDLGLQRFTSIDLGLARLSSIATSISALEA